VALLLVAVVLAVAGGFAGTYSQYRDATEASGVAREENRLKDLALVKANKAEKDALEKETQARRELNLSRRSQVTAQLRFVGSLCVRQPELGRQLLEDYSICPLDLHDFAWRYYFRACDRLGLRFTGRRDGGALDGAITCVAFTPDGKTLASSSVGREQRDNIPAAERPPEVVRLWDVATGRQRGALRGHARTVGPLAFGPDGRLLASGSVDGTIKLWDAPAGKELATLEGHRGPIQSLAFSGDGKILASGSDDQTIKLWDVPTRRPRDTLEGHTAAVTTVAFLSDGRSLASAGKEVKVWDAIKGQERVTRLQEASGPVAFSADGQTIAWRGPDNTALLWDTATRKKPLALKGHEGPITAVAFSSDGKTLITGGEDWEVRLWNVATGQERTVLGAGHRVIHCLAIAPDDTTLAVGDEAVIQLWATHPGPRSLTLEGGTGELGLTFAADGKTVAANTAPPGEAGKTVKVWDLTTGKVLTTIQEKQDIWPVAITADGKVVLTTSARTNVPARPLQLAIDGQPEMHVIVKSWKRPAGHEGARFNLGSDLEFGPFFIALSPDGRTLATTTEIRGPIKLWDLTSGRQCGALQDSDDERYVQLLAFSPDGNILAAITCRNIQGKDAVVKLWELGTGKVRATFQCNGDLFHWTPLAFSADSKMLVVLDEQGARVWDTRSGQEMSSLKGRPGPATCAVAFSEDGMTLASGDRTGKVKLWDVITGQERASLQEHAAAVCLLKFTPDGHALLSVDMDGTVKRWEAYTGPKRASFPSASLPAALSRDGKLLVAWSNEDERLKLWDLTTGQERPRTKSAFNFDPHLRCRPVFAPDGESLAVGGYPASSGSRWDGVSLWDPSSGKLRATFPIQAEKAENDFRAVGSLAFSPDGRILAAAYSENVAGDFAVRLDMPGPDLILPDNGDKQAPPNANPKRVEEQVPNEVILWDTATGRKRAVFTHPHTAVIGELAFSRDGRILAVVAWDGPLAGRECIKLWDVAEGREWASLKLPADDAFLAFSPDCRSVAASSLVGKKEIQHVKILDVATGKERCILKGRDWSIVEAAFSPDGKILATADFWSTTAKLWDVATGKELASFDHETASVASLMFTADGRILATVGRPDVSPGEGQSEDHGVKLWVVPPVEKAVK
jgi:WD40 repeat protein